MRVENLEKVLEKLATSQKCAIVIAAVPAPSDDGPFDRLLQIGVGQQHERGSAAEFHRELLQGAARLGWSIAEQSSSW
jgi:hypothetical protein